MKLPRRATMVRVNGRLTSVDARVFWMSAKIPNDQFLLYAFAGQPTDMDTAVAEVLARARSCPDLQMRVEDRNPLAYPAWARRDVDAEQVATHVGERSWRDCVDTVATLADRQLDLRRAGWRLHVFAPVLGAPGCAEAGTVAVLQIGHALGDGIRSSALAGVLFGRPPGVPQPARRGNRGLIRRAIGASRAHRQLERDTAAGLVPPPAPPRPVLSTNNRPNGARTARTLTRKRSQMRGPTVTVEVLTAISAALSGYLRDRGEDAKSLGAEVPVAKAGVRLANNHFGNVGVNLYPDVDAQQRARLIADELADRRRRGGHRAFSTGDLALAAVPAPLLRWGVRQFDADARSPVVTGNTVVSSVNRGPADLIFGGLPVILTAGYPALSPMMGLTHGVHGIGDTIAISVHTAVSAMADIDEYLDRLGAALAN